MTGIGLTVGQSCGTAAGLQPCENLPGSLTASCGPNPCGFLDSLLNFGQPSDDCNNYQICADPGSAAAILASQGLLAGSATVVGEYGNQVVSDFTSSLFGQQNPDGTTTTNWVMVAFAGIGGFLILKMLKVI